MPRFKFIFLVDATTDQDAEGATLEEALEKAASEVHASVCHQCSSAIEVADVLHPLEAYDLDTGKCYDLMERS